MAKKEAQLIVRIKEMGSEALGKVTITLGDIANAAQKVFQALAAPIQAFRESEKASNALTQSLVNQGIYSKELVKAYKDQASELQNVTAFADDCTSSNLPTFSEQIV